MIETSFRAHFPIEHLAKASDFGYEDAPDRYYIRGIGATQDEDSVGESILISGLDISWINERGGNINWEHGAKKEPAAVLGELTKAWKEPVNNPNRVMVEGFLYTAKKEARDAVELMDAMHKAGSSRRLGLSIEGKILQRHNNKIIKSMAHSVAMSPLQINGNCVVLEYGPDLAKALQAGYCANPELENCPECDSGGCCTKCEVTGTRCGEVVEKTLEAGYGASPETQVDGGALRKESLEGKSHYICPVCKKKTSKASTHSHKTTPIGKSGVHNLQPDLVNPSGNTVSKSLTFDEAVKFVMQRNPALTKPLAAKFVGLVNHRLDQGW